MVMKNEKGITLVELLVAVVIAGIIIVPFLTIMTGTFTRTASQEKETQIAYKIHQIQTVLETSKSSGMQTINMDITKLVQNGMITRGIADEYVPNWDKNQ